MSDSLLSWVHFSVSGVFPSFVCEGEGGGALAAGVIQTFSAQNFYLSTGSVQMRQGHLHAIWLKQSLPLLLKMDLAPVEDKRLNYIYDKSAEAVEA